MNRSLSRIDLELAREPGRPEGDRNERYTILAPLDAERRIDAEAWGRMKDQCRVTREHDGRLDTGRLVHGPGGRWLIRYEDPAEAEESGFRLQEERFEPGEYVSIARDDEMHVYRVVSARPL